MSTENRGGQATKPNFFIVGAPKCGTTAMNDYLSQHPEIFIPEMKEIHYFGKDLEIKFGALRDEQKYLDLFKGSEGHKVRGEASVWYLYSKTAAAEIHRFNPDAKIIIMLRDPADMLYSQHSEFLYNGNENIEDFGQALAAEPERKAGKRIPESAHFAEGLWYSETVKYAAQVQRYVEYFGRENVHIIIFDDFKRDLKGVYRELLTFLGVDPTFAAEFEVINPNKRARSKRLRSFVQAPPEGVKRLGRLLFPRSVRQKVMAVLEKANVRYEKRTPQEQTMRRQLQERFAPEVEKLEALLGRKLPWSTGDDRANSLAS